MRFFATALIAVALAACSAPAGASVAPTAQTQPSPAPSAAVDPGPALDPGALVAAGADRDGQMVRVKGFLLAAGGATRICSVVMESYPPQCGGGTLTLDGKVPDDVVAGLERTTEPGLAEANWGWVEVTGTFEAAGSGGMPTITISEIRLSAP
jgi:hypothetical protein